MKSCVAHRTTPSPMTFSDLEGHICCLKPFYLTYLGKYDVYCLSYVYTYMNRKAHVACDFNYIFENEGALKVTASHVHCKSGNISETVPDKSRCLYIQTTNSKWYMIYRIEAILMTLSHIQGHFLLQAF